MVASGGVWLGIIGHSFDGFLYELALKSSQAFDATDSSFRQRREPTQSQFQCGEDALCGLPQCSRRIANFFLYDIADDHGLGGASARFIRRIRGSA